MTCESVLMLCLCCLSSVGSVPATILAGHSDGVTPPMGEPDITTSPSVGYNLTPLPRTHLAATAQPSSGQQARGLFERYIAGLGRLTVALRDPEYDWEARAHATPAVPVTVHHENTNSKDEIRKLFALAGTMKRLSDTLEQQRFDDGDTELQNDETTDGHATFPHGTEAGSPSRLRAAVTAAVNDLSRLFHRYFWHQLDTDEDIRKDKREEKEKGIQVLVKALEALAEAHTNYTVATNATKISVVSNMSDFVTEERYKSTTNYTVAINAEGTPVVANRSAFATGGIPESSTSTITENSVSGPLDWLENQRGLLQVVAQLRALLGHEPLGSDGNHTVPAVQTWTMPFTITTTTTTTTTRSIRDAKPREQPCLPPFELIAYRMCILQEMNLKLTWTSAQKFCWDRGAELAQDMVVIKTRRYLNGLFGEEGTRTRWPVWVGGRRVELSWRWVGGPEVPGFLWAPEEPRVYSSHLVPEGLCMMLDGYRRFYGASLPCHLRRRFICQLRD